MEIVDPEGRHSIQAAAIASDGQGNDGDTRYIRFLSHQGQDTVSAAPRQGGVENQYVGRGLAEPLDALQSAGRGNHDKAVAFQTPAVILQQALVSASNQYPDRSRGPSLRRFRNLARIARGAIYEFLPLHGNVRGTGKAQANPVAGNTEHGNRQLG